MTEPLMACNDHLIDIDLPIPQMYRRVRVGDPEKKSFMINTTFIPIITLIGSTVVKVISKIVIIFFFTFIL